LKLTFKFVLSLHGMMRDAFAFPFTLTVMLKAWRRY